MAILPYLQRHTLSNRKKTWDWVYTEDVMRCSSISWMNEATEKYI